MSFEGKNRAGYRCKSRIGRAIAETLSCPRRESYRYGDQRKRRAGDQRLFRC